MDTMEILDLNENSNTNDNKIVTNTTTSNNNNNSTLASIDTDSIYILPKTLNGKTVTDLFPEFQYNAVLRFSKLFGIGRQTSLPKIWKGTRKRKKPKQLQTSLVEKQQIENLFDETSTHDKEKLENIQLKDAETNEYEKPVEEIKTKSDENDQDDEPEYDTDDEEKLLRSFLIDDVKKANDSMNELSPSNQNKSDSKSRGSNQKADLYDPALYWHELYKSTEKEEKTEESKKSDNEEDEDEADNSFDNEIIDLSSAVKNLTSQVKEEAYLLVNSINWEDNIIFDLNQNLNISANNNYNKKISLLNNSNDITNTERIKFAGWIPSNEHRTLASFQSRIFGKKCDYLNHFKEQLNSNSGNQHHHHLSKHNSNINQNLNWYSIFPNENYDLLSSDWENKIIFDPKNTSNSKINPKFYFDLNDDNLLIGIHEEKNEKDSTNQQQQQQNHQPENQEHRKWKRKDKTNNIVEPVLNVNEESNDTEMKKQQSEAQTNNFWNVSNDEYYSAKQINDSQALQSSTAATSASKSASTSLTVQHTLPAYELNATLFPTHLSVQKCRTFHRYVLKRFLSGCLSNETIFNCVSSQLKKFISSSEFQSIRSIRDLNPLDKKGCEFILAEYSEQYPPLMSQIGMASKIRNYYKRKFAKDDGPANRIDYGELVFINQSPFLGMLKPGEYLQSIENYMFRAPIYKHKTSDQDFLIIRSRLSGYTIRSDIKNIFVVGQECPLIEVPGPNSKRANSFMKDFLQVYIFRLFNQSNEIPKRVKMEDVKKAFPQLPENSIRKRLKCYADLRRTGKIDSEVNWWILKDDVKLPSEEDIRNMVTPEQCCAYYSMLAAEQRLKDAGYGERNLFASDDENNEENNENNREINKIEDEVKNAPWHTTRSYLDAVKGKCLLQINGVADPTGRGEGFSYVRLPFNKQKENQDESILTKENKKEKINEMTNEINDSVSSPQANNQDKQQQNKRSVTGTDADLRRLHLSEAKELLASYGVPDSEIKKLKRWEIIDVVRTMSTQKAKEGNAAISKFARGTTSSKFSQSDQHDKYREECQRLFELQNRNLASEEYLSTDDDEDMDQDSDLDEMGKNLESMLQNKNNNQNTSNNNNNKSINNNNNQTNITNIPASKPNDTSNSSELKNIILDESKKQAEPTPPDNNPNLRRILKITRTFRDEETGQEYTKVEVVKKPLIIDAYVKIRTTKDDEFIRTAFALDQTEKEKLRKERRRLQEQLRKFKRDEAKEAKKVRQLLDENGMPRVPRKYNKTGLNRKPKIPKAQKNNLNDTNTNQSLLVSSPDSKNKMNYSSCDDAGNPIANTTLDTSSQPQQPQKRKYTKRKKLLESAGNNGDDPNLSQNQIGNFTKVEGTKIIIQKKAIKFALKHAGADSDVATGADGSSPVKKRKLTKKQLKLIEQQQASSGDFQIINDDSINLDQSTINESQLRAPTKIKIINKAKNKDLENKPSIILTIPKDKIVNNDSSINTVNTAVNSSSANTSGTCSPAVDVISVNDNGNSNAAASLKQQELPKPKRQYNKQNSLLKKQQKMVIQQQMLQQQQQPQLDPSAAALASIASLFNDPAQQQQNLLLAAALQQMSANQNDQAALLAAAALLSTQTQPQLQQQQSTNSQSSGQQKRKLNSQSSQNLDYLVKPHKKVDRRHADPSVSLATILETIIDELRGLPEAQPFLIPVNSKKVPDYYNVVRNPIDIQTIRKRINEKYYKDRATFLDDMQLLIDNSALYNGINHVITDSAERLFHICNQRLEEHRDKLSRLEKAINPLLDDNSLIAFNYLLDQIYEQNIITVENSFAFLKPVNKAKYKDYYDIIKQPIDLETIKSKIQNKKYRSRQQFLNDFDLLYENCLRYNGDNNSYSNTAEKLFTSCRQAIEIDYGEQLFQLEDAILNSENDNNFGDFNEQTDTNDEAPRPTHSRHLSSVSNSNNNNNDFLIDTESEQANFLASISANPEAMALAAMLNTTSTGNESIDESMMQFLLSQMQQSQPQQPTSSTKKLKPSKSSSSAIDSNSNIFGQKSSKATVGEISRKSSGNNANNSNNKKMSFSSLKMTNISAKDSPRSGSDAEVFVDVESVDDGRFMNTSSTLASSSSNSHSKRSKFSNNNQNSMMQTNICEEEYLVDNYAYQDDANMNYEENE